MMKETWMKEALKLAKLSFDEGEIPVGAVITRNSEIISRGRNRRENGKNALYHAEIEAIDNACKALGGWRLWECELFVTLEPCAMCAGAIINARIPKVYFGAYDKNGGCCGSSTDLFQLKNSFHPTCEGGILEEECAALLSEFFKKLRN